MQGAPQNEHIVQLIRSRLASGQLPAQCPERKLFAGSGDGAPCACCDLLITSQQVQYDVECLNRKGEAELFRMHLQCFTVWAEVSSPR